MADRADLAKCLLDEADSLARARQHYGWSAGKGSDRGDLLGEIVSSLERVFRELAESVSRISTALSDIQQRQDERNSRLLKMGEDAKRRNFMSKFDERGY